ncbi:hypothetical protein GCM10027612_73160 [Microbispora bryophytorum subsp. camponoti]
MAAVEADEAGQHEDLARFEADDGALEQHDLLPAPVPMGCTRRPPSRNCSTSGAGTVGKAAETMTAS